MNYIYLGVVTDYTLLTSLIKIDDLINFSIKNNYKVLGILNDNLYSTMEFYTKCIKNNIKPIIGLIKSVDNKKYYIYPKNYNGLIDLFNARDNSDNLLYVIPYQYKELYNELEVNNKFISYKNKDELKNSLLITNNVVSLYEIYAFCKEESNYVNYLHLIDNGLTISNYSFIDYSNNVFLDKFDEFDIKTTNSFVNNIDIVIKNDKKYIPKFIDNSYDYLKKLSISGLKKRLKDNVSDIYKKRLLYELDVINNMGYVDYFLIVYDYVKYSKNNNIMVGPGRGSAAGSLVSYSLGITEIDPIKYDLLFERFLNPERITMPDIDIDFDALKRSEVIDYVIKKYGREYVSNIMTFSTLGSKQVLRDVSKSLEVDSKIVDRLCSFIDAKLSLKDNLNDNVKRMLNQFSNLKNAYYVSMKLEGIKRQTGTHAAGVVISSEKLTNVIPIIKSNDNYLTGYTMEYLEELGLLKMDFLAIKDLSILDFIISSIESKIKRKINIHNIRLDDEETYREFSKGNTSGVFQFESSGMKNFLTKLKPSCFSDLIAALALFRPGPMGNIDTYIARKNGKEEIDYIHPSLEKILKSTYGIIIYQEQIMQILSLMANYSYAESDLIRRAISKKKLNIIEEEKNKFISNSIKNGYSETVCRQVYELIVKFANYGFNKSHSVAYALVGYEMCYLKSHYPLYFYQALLNFNIGSESKTKEYIDVLKKMNINILKPDINLSGDKYHVINNSLLLPINIIKNIGTSVADIIVRVREDGFKDYFDFVKKINIDGIGVKTIEVLIQAGCCDSFNLNRHTMIENLGNAITYSELSSGIDSSLVSKPEIKEYEEYSNSELVSKENELYGFYLSSHPVSKYNNKVKINNIENYFDKMIDIYLYVEDIKTIKTKNGEDMAFISCSDETGIIDAIVFPNKYNLINDIKKYDIVLINAKVEKRYDKCQLVVNKILKQL
ncbi:MAG: DNA polymerase III subunit alpha [Bacilli bacterium]|nr:DNA polymerase III subunit alpha [Bacilli bacterium]